MAHATNRVLFYPLWKRATDFEKPVGYRWHIIAKNGRIVAASSETFATKASAKRNFRTTLRMMQDAKLWVQP